MSSRGVLATARQTEAHQLFSPSQKMLEVAFNSLIPSTVTFIKLTLKIHPIAYQFVVYLDIEKHTHSQTFNDHCQGDIYML